MGSQNNFKHIVLKEAAVEDEVIYAGVCPSTDKTHAHHTDVSDLSNAAIQNENQQERVIGRKGQRLVDAQDEAGYNAKTTCVTTKGDSSAHLQKPPSKSHKRDSFHETTLDDLTGMKMPLSQKIVIIAAIVLIIVALMYYFLVLR